MKILFKILILTIGLSSCQKSIQSTQIAFYHWQTQLQLTGFEKDYLKQTDSEKLYIKYFDVDWQNGKAVPLAMLETSTWKNDSLEIIPCVFITNRTMLEIDETAIPQLAKNIYIKINELNYGFPKNTIQEIQLDCDWTERSRANYFLLLQELRKSCPENYQLSATIRLHQVKYYERTQVPPVDKGMLMYYNMGDVDNPETENSILDEKIAAQYLVNFEEYPLSLDLALPIFAWGVLFRDGKIIKLMNNLDAESLADTERFAKVGAHQFRVQKSTYLDGYYLYAGDEIRLESVSKARLQSATQLLKPHLQNKDLTITYYHLDSLTIRHYEADFLKNILKSYPR